MNFIFDLYGTLVDIHTDEQSAKFKKAFSEYFKTVNPRTDFFREYYALCSKLARVGGDNLEIDLSKVFNALAGEKSQEAATRFRELSTAYIRVYDGVYDFLERLKSRGAKLYILSNAQSCFTLRELEKLNLTRYFDGIEISSDFGKKKPDPTFFESVLSKYGLKREDGIYTGNDLHDDVLGAKSVNLRTAYIKSNLSPESDTLEKAAALADFACDGHEKLFKYLLSALDGNKVG